MALIHLLTPLQNKNCGEKESKLPFVYTPIHCIYTSIHEFSLPERGKGGREEEGREVGDTGFVFNGAKYLFFFVCVCFSSF